jgi:hypothetical protein
MTDADTPDGSAHDGAMTPEHGSPVAVDVSRDRLNRDVWLVFLGGPVLWFSHFVVVYLVAEAGCTGDGPGLRAFNPPVPKGVTLAATAVAAAGCLLFAAWGRRRWRAARQGMDAADHPDGLADRDAEQDDGGALELASVLLSLFSFVAVLFVGLPAPFLEC